MDNVISVRNLTNRFGKTTVHQNLDLDVRRGEVLGVVGASGSGKSVLLRSIVGLQRPSAGTITVLGTEVLTDPPTETEANAGNPDAVQNKWGVMFPGWRIVFVFDCPRERRGTDARKAGP